MKTAFEKLAIEIKKLNGDWKPDFNNENQFKYFNYFQVENGLFVFCGVNYCYGVMYVPSALHLKTKELAIYTKDTFFDLYKEYYLYEVNNVETIKDTFNETDLTQKLLQWYNGINKDILFEQLNILRDSNCNVATEDIINMVGSLLTIHNDSERVTYLKDIETKLTSVITKMGFGMPDNFDSIVQYICNELLPNQQYSETDIKQIFIEYLDKI